MQAWILRLYSGAKGRIQKHLFKIPRIHLIILCTDACRRLNSSSLLMGLHASQQISTNSTAPFSKVISYTTIGNKKFAAQWIPYIGKIVFAFWNIQFTEAGIFVDACICCWAFPTSKCIDKYEIKWAAEKAVLWYKTFVVLAGWLLMCRWCYERTARIMQQLFPGKLPLELRVDSIYRGASFWNRV